MNENEYTYFIDSSFFIYRTCLKEIRRHNKPNLVHTKNIYTKKNIYLYMFYNYPNINVLDINRNDLNKKYRLYCNCKIDNNIWDAYLTNFMSKNTITGCKECKKRKEAEKIFSTNPKLFSFLRDSISTWRIESIKRSDYKCVITNDRFDDVHHIYSFNKIVSNALKILNIDISKDINQYTIEELLLLKNNFLNIHNSYGFGVCIRKDIHNNFHSIYGYDNNEEQWKEFKNKTKKES